MTSQKIILIHPIISEKSVRDKEQGKYSFKVDMNSNKSEIKKVVEEKFKVKVDKVNTIKVPSKNRKMGRFSGKTSQWKKAIITLSDGQTIKELDNI
ncbi:MAG: 50S ribosomal protein L23 [Candidatus Caldatribacteriota bacterium]|jgi:large subunit ribosomal protein L23|nr:50S ribosomal protein L23 [Atribacterota bacterium]MDD3031578.1 50S ribosomal protein L23 [Atribacterota bacterium]MDD4288501.1 50S ribosomal protein L23 [Atribacterota bacterium]MDI9596861.1 50S ribosomal protein L23 [Atribacterota bacterium]